MSSFYGNGGGTSSKVINSLNKKAKRHIVASESEPFDQQIGDLWLVLEKDEDENKTRVDLTYNTAEGIFEGQIETGIMTAAQLEESYDFYGEIDENEISFMVVDITDQLDCTLIKLFSPMVEGIVECGYYYKTGRITKRLRAVLEDGVTINRKLKRLAGITYYWGILQTVQEKTALGIRLKNNLPENFDSIDYYIISDSSSDSNIYVWYNLEDKYYQIYTEVNNLKCGEKTLNGLFSSFSKLANIELLNLDTSNATTMQACFLSCYGLVSDSFLQEWDLSNITSIKSSFADNYLQQISYLGKKLNFAKITSFNSAFYYTRNLTNVYITQEAYNDFLTAVENGADTTDMWRNSKISQFTIIDS